ncbi:two component transcriptional regulator, LytTR family [Hymenobacter roseosalivarius DSM 11622]|uniref:Two component transcriptional regulator, LytTR family n=1 Tax=Hymenobacter roseosalivarius DSM 11622 TaxID=645990 RepID=A0A1W1VXI5_9BACT|nr:LytTR family DNA-binding domain-containing protein [Hymenobacter roseosalivarius]SMB97960.1 two component transcriptional regulator, LytTR family [Hymenobacter roseosalivarius DSM 11622]
MSTLPALRALLVEDEPLAARRLTELLRRQEPAVEVVATAESVAAAKVLLDTLQPAPDVLFLDIHLADGLSFELFEQTTVPCPVIFTTAYDQYAIRAFKVNSVDYLLKPIDAGELEAAVQKLRARRGSAQMATPATAFDPALLAQVLQQMQARPAYKEQFVVRVGEHLKTVATEQIAYFFSLEKATLLQTRENRRFVVDYTLEQLETLLDPRQFFRLNRTYLAQASAIQDIIHYTNSRLQTVLQHCPEGPVLVSRERVPAFKAWLDR